MALLPLPFVYLYFGPLGIGVPVLSGGVAFPLLSTILGPVDPRFAHWAQSSGSRENSSVRAWSSRENRSYERSRLRLTVWLGSRGAGNRGGQGIDGESADGEEGESGFEEHDDMECCED